MNHRLNSDETTAITADVKWLPITQETPIGVKMLLINKADGVAHVSVLRTQDKWTHWCPLPTFLKTAS